ncbi:MAG: hypothetical protein Q9M94_04110, partial [Candidatus Gracilibacteria bacterium]|nr:hypothetical protein [Candidatus Gracilibacteria bacterium]
GIYKYIYFIIIFIFSSIIITVFHGFLLNTTLILFLIFLLLFTFSDFLKLLFSKIGTGIYNTIFLLFLALFFYIAPLISTNLLDIKLKTINSVVKTSLYNDKALDFNCVYFINNNFINNDYIWNSGKCRGITDTNLYFYYFLYLMLNFAFILSITIVNKRKD